MNGKKGTALRKGFLVLILFLVSSSAVLFPRPISITVLEKKLKDGTTKQVLLIGIQHIKDIGRTELDDRGDYQDYFNNIRDFIALKKTWQKPVDFLVEYVGGQYEESPTKEPRLKSFQQLNFYKKRNMLTYEEKERHTNKAEQLLKKYKNLLVDYSLHEDNIFQDYSFEKRLLREYGKNVQKACPFHFIQVDRRPPWLAYLLRYIVCKYQLGRNPPPIKSLDPDASRYCGTIGEFRTYLKDVHARIATIDRLLPGWLKKSSRIELWQTIIKFFAKLYVEDRADLSTDCGNMDDDVPMIEHFEKMDQQDNKIHEKLNNFLSVNNTVMNKEYSAKIISAYGLQLIELLFFYEIAYSQKDKDKTILMCGFNHKALIIKGLEECGYTKTRERREGKTRIPAREIREWITGFCGLCDECGETGVKICTRCKYVRYCGRPCQRSGWKRLKHGGCCKTIENSLVHE